MKTREIQRTGKGLPTSRAGRRYLRFVPVADRAVHPKVKDHGVDNSGGVRRARVGSELASVIDVAVFQRTLLIRP
jgi:hypothetical protein